MRRHGCRHYERRQGCRRSYSLQQLPFFGGGAGYVASGGVGAGLRVILLGEGISVGVCRLIFKIENCTRIDCVAHETCLEMKMRSGGTTR